MVTSNAKNASSEDTEAVHEAGSFKQSVQDGLGVFEREIMKKSTFEAVCQVLLTVLGIIAVVGTGGLALIFAALYYITQENK